MSAVERRVNRKAERFVMRTPRVWRLWGMCGTRKNAQKPDSYHAHPAPPPHAAPPAGRPPAPSDGIVRPGHGATAGQRPAEPAGALGSLLLTAGLAGPQVAPGPQTRATRWRDHVAGQKILLLLDDAASHDQV